MVLHVIRAVFVLAVLAISISYATKPEVLEPPQMDAATGEPQGLTPVTKVVLVVLIPVVLGVVLILVDMAVEHKSLGQISGLFFGLVAGVVLAVLWRYR